MANTIQIRRHSSNTDTSAPGSLLTGELALNQADKKLYVGRHNNSSVEVFHLPTLQDITYGNGVTGTVASGSNDNSVTLAVDVTDSNIFGTTSAKGIAQFNSDNFAVSSGVVTIKDNGVILGTETVGNYMTDISASTGVTVSHTAAEGSTATISIGQAVATSDSPTFAGVTADDIKVGVTASNEIDTSSGNLIIDSAGGTVQVDDNLTVTGNLTVNGTTTTVNSTTVTIDDPMIKLAANQTSTDDDLVDTGIYMTYDVSDTQNYSGIFRDTSNSNKSWVFVEGITGEPGSTVTYTASDLAYIEAIIDGGTY